VYSFLRWDIWNFFRNIWKFRKELLDYRWWDYHYTLQMLYRSIAIMEKNMHGGHENERDRNKKIQKMQRLLVLLENKIEDKYTDIAELELGYSLKYGNFEFKPIDVDSDGEELYEIISNTEEKDDINNRKIYDLANKIEESEWSEIWQILEGTNNVDSSIQQLNTYDTETGKVDMEDWDDGRDGTGLRSWWD
jgi:flagellar biosynthesis chaperone FliJ